MTSSGRRRGHSTRSRCWCLLTFWSVVSLSWTSNAANSISVLDSKLSSLYQKFHHHQPYGYEPPPPPDAGYATRNAFRPHHHAPDDGYHTRTVPYDHDDGYNTKTVPYPHHAPVDDGYHTKTVPYAHDDGYNTRTVPYHHVRLQYPDGYATRTAFHPRRRSGGGKDAAPADDGYETRMVEFRWFPLYQPYQHTYDAEAGGHATRTAAYRSAGQQRRTTTDSSASAAAAPAAAKSELVDDGYQTKTGAPSHRGPRDHDPGGYASRNVVALRPYRSALEQVGDDPRGHDDDGYWETVALSRHATKDLQRHDDGETGRDGELVYGDDDGGMTTEWSRERLERSPAAAAAAAVPVSTEGGWRSAVGRLPRVELRLPANSRVAQHHQQQSTGIDRFAQEEDVTGAAIGGEPIGRLADSDSEAAETTSSNWRSISKQSDGGAGAGAGGAKLRRPATKFDRRRRPIAADRRHNKLDACRSLSDGDYPLDKRFRRVLPLVDKRCNFVKCAHRATFINPCSAGTRNPDHELDAQLDAADPQTTGMHYCSVRDIDEYCRHHYYHPSDDDQQQQQLTLVKHHYFV